MSEQNYQESQIQGKAHGASTNQDASFHGNGLEEAGAGTGQNFTSQFLDAGTAADQAGKATDIRAGNYMRGVSSAPSGQLNISDSEISEDGLSLSAKAAINKAAVTERLRGQGVDESSIQRARAEVDRRSVAEETRRTPFSLNKAASVPQTDQAQSQAEEILAADAINERENDARALAQAQSRLGQSSEQSGLQAALAQIDALIQQTDIEAHSQPEPMPLAWNTSQNPSEVLADAQPATGNSFETNIKGGLEKPRTEQQILRSQDRDILANSVYSEFAAETPFMQLMEQEERRAKKAA